MKDAINRLQTTYNELILFLQSKGINTDSINASVPMVGFELKASSLKSLKVACIMDAFTRLSYAPECELQDLTPDGWKEELVSFSPDMLFIESAWQGKNGLWHRKIANGSKELFELTKYCKSKKIPIVYWGKEDPVYTQTFMPAAAQADVIFTCDLDSIPVYKAGTGNPHVYHLHFAAQPTIHNPVETLERKDKFCFAGAYYHRYPERSKVFDDFADYFIATKGFDIYDRNYGNALPEHAFPSRYNPYILGRLAPEEIDTAYKGYRYGINLNSITQSQTMFARRIFELIASNTLVIGNYALGVKQYFGDLTIATNSVATMKNTLEKYCGTIVDSQKLSLLALRKVLSEHLYEDRLAYIVEKVFGKNLKRTLPKIAVVVHVEDKGAQAAFERQNYENKMLYVYSQTNDSQEKLDSIDADYVAYLFGDDYYGANYLTDFALATRFLGSDIDGVGKSTYWSDGAFINEGGNYKYVPTLAPKRGMVKINSFKEIKIADIFETSLLEGNFFSTDSFNYAQNHIGDACFAVDDIQNINTGLPLREIEKVAEQVPMVYANDTLLTLTSDDALKLFNQRTEARGVSAVKEDGTLSITSAIVGDGAEYVYFPEIYPLSAVSLDGQMRIMFNAVSDDFVGLTVIFLDDKKQNIGNKFIAAGHVASIKVKEEAFAKATHIRVALRCKGNGSSSFTSVKFSNPVQVVQDSPCLVNSDTLILTNIYPSYDNLYRNMFVHARVKAYKEHGLNCDVLCTNIYAKNEYREFEGANVIEGHIQRLADVMNTGKIKTVCVHFLDEQMFTVLKAHLDNIRLIVWVHGAEIQPWWRREYNYADDAERNRAKIASEKRMAFWHEVFALSETRNIHFVFVSQYFADEVMEDYKVKLPTDKYSIIHNMIDTETFNYVEKDAEQRKRIFSCRPFSSKTYANDLSVNAILELSKTEAFSDMFFHIAGTGELFNELTRPLRKFANVQLEERYYSHSEISKLHKEFGVCLIPSRMDTQGVSRDEAMSSGLVPVTTAVAAIPEFVDEECAMLVDVDDWQSLTDAILKLYNNPKLFMQLSVNAAKRVRKQSAKPLMIKKEMAFIKEEKETIMLLYGGDAI